VTERRRRVAQGSFWIGLLLLAAAAATLVAAWVLPYEGLQDLGRVVMAMLLAAASAIPFGIAVAVGYRLMPRWMLGASVAGLCLALLPALALVGAALRG
jgi:hypothetical protein